MDQALRREIVRALAGQPLADMEAGVETWTGIARGAVRDLPVPDEPAVKAQIAADFGLMVAHVANSESRQPEQLAMWRKELRAGAQAAAARKFARLYTDDEQTRVTAEWEEFARMTSDELSAVLGECREIRMPQHLWDGLIDAYAEAVCAGVITPKWATAVDLVEAGYRTPEAKKRLAAQLIRDHTVHLLQHGLANELAIMDNVFAVRPELVELKPEILKFRAQDYRDRIRQHCRSRVRDGVFFFQDGLFPLPLRLAHLNETDLKPPITADTKGWVTLGKRE